MGAPVLTLRGDRHAARVGASLLERLNLTHLVAENEDAFVERGVALASNQTALAELRAGLRARMQHSPLMDAPGFARAVEDVFRELMNEPNIKSGTDHEKTAFPELVSSNGGARA